MNKMQLSMPIIDEKEDKLFDILTEKESRIFYLQLKQEDIFIELSLHI